MSKNNKSKKPSVWVTPHPDGWAVKREGGKKPSHVSKLKKDAVKIGHNIAKNNETEFIVQKKNGQIQSKDSFGNDPNPPLDKEH